MSTYYPEAAAGNGAIAVKALGAAYDPDHYKLYYLSIAGPSVACEAIRASLQKNNNPYLASLMPWLEHWLGVPEKLQYEVTKLPGSPEVHMVLWDKDPASITIAHPAYLLARHQPPGLERQQTIDALATAAQQTARRIAADRLNKITKVPVLASWIDTILTRIPTYDRQYAVHELECKGDAIYGIHLNQKYDWKNLICNLLRDGWISIPDPITA